MQSEEGLREAGGEGRLGFCDAVFGTGHLGGVARDEVEHGLFGCQFRDRRQDAARVAGEQDDVGWVGFRQAWDLGVVDVLDRIGATSVFGQGCVVVVDFSSFLVEDDVLEDGAELDSVENVWFLLCRETNAFRVALMKGFSKSTETIPDVNNLLLLRC